MNRLTVCFALDTDKPSGPVYETEAEARRQPEHIHLGENVRRLYVDAAGVIVHSEIIPDGPEE